MNRELIFVSVSTKLLATKFGRTIWGLSTFTPGM